MKAIFDRHAEGLSGAERQAIWRTISGTRVPEPRSRRLRLLATASAVAAVSLIAVAVVNREPPAPRGGVAMAPRVVAPHIVAPRVEIVVPTHRMPVAARKVRPLDLRRDPALATAESLSRVPVAPRIALSRAAPQRPSPAASSPTGRVMGVIMDARSQPLPYTNVIVVGTGLGTMADSNGAFQLMGIPAGTAEIQVQPLGYDKQIRRVAVDAGATTTIAFNFGDSEVVKQIEEIEVRSAKRIDTKSSSTVQSITSEHLRQVPVDNLRGGHDGDAHALGPAAPAPPPVVPTTGGSRLPNDEPYDSMFFRNYGVNPFVATEDDSLSTFAVDVDAASYTLARRYIELGHLPPADAVRVEEFVNFFPQGYPKFEDDDFRILVDGAPSPFGRGYHLLRVGIKGREIPARDRKPARLTFVVDVSGSMAREDRLELVKQALRLLVDQLRDDDRIGIVVFGTTAHILLEPVGLGEPVAVAAGAGRDAEGPNEERAAKPETGRQCILEAIDLLHPEGSTNTEQGLLMGYEMARGAYRPGAINRIVLCSDGVANEGHTGPQSILERVRSEADKGIHLSTIGFGMGNYNDVLMEQLADKGDGNYYYVDDLSEARRVLVENLTGTLQTIARDAKIQVEFHSSRVVRYRLLGFENRDVADRDFRNDKVDAGEIGAGHEVTALYEVKLAPEARKGPIATVRLRYARPEKEGGTPDVREIAKDFGTGDLGRRFEDAAPRFRLDAAVAEFAEILRGSYWAKGSKLSDVLPVARNAARGLREEAVTEFISLLEKATALGQPREPEERRGEP